MNKQHKKHNACQISASSPDGRGLQISFCLGEALKCLKWDGQRGETLAPSRSPLLMSAPIMQE